MLEKVPVGRVVLLSMAHNLTSQRESAIDGSLGITIVGRKDGLRQPAIFYLPQGAPATTRGPKGPLAVFLHTWSADYKSVGPDLRETELSGPNERPEACASGRAGPVRLTVFEGAHSVDAPTSFLWLDSMSK